MVKHSSMITDTFFLALVFLQCVVVLLLVFVAWRQRQAHFAISECKSAINNLDVNPFRQAEALLGLYKDLNLQAGLPPTRGWAASPDFLRILAGLVAERKPQVVIECSSGVSTVVVARRLQINGAGHVYSMEQDPYYAQRTRLELQRHHLDSWATVVVAPLREHSLKEGVRKWYSDERLPPELVIDLLVIDGPPYFTGPVARYPAVPRLYERLRADAMVILDDANRSQEKKALSLWARDYPDLVRQPAPECEKGCALLVKSAVAATTPGAVKN